MAKINQTIADWLGQMKKSETDTPLMRWCILAIATISLWFWVVEPLQTWNQDLSEQLGRNSDKASRLVALEQNKDAWIEAEIQAQAVMADVEHSLYVSPSNTVAQANIQNVIQQFATSRNLNIESQKLISAEVFEPIGYRLAIEVGLRGELADVLQYLDDVSSANKLFMIDRWIVQMDRNKKAYARFVVAGLRPASLEEEF